MTSLLLALQLFVADTTDQPFPYSIKQPVSEFNWKKYEMPVSKRVKDSIVDALEVNYDLNFKTQAGKLHYLDSTCHIVDLDNDRYPDVVYEGWTGSEGTMVDIYINRRFRLEKVFTEYMKVIDWTFTGNRLSSIVIVNYGCCAENVQFEMHYSVDDKFRFTCTKQRAILAGMDKIIRENLGREAYFEKPFQFKTLNADYALRHSPEISDKVPAGLDLSLDEQTIGNIIAQYPKGATGTAWAYKNDAEGREWWLVEMDPQGKLSFSHFWNNQDRPTYYFGWMSSRFVEKIK